MEIRATQSLGLSYWGRFTMRKQVICALALSGAAVSAQAADLSITSMKDPLPDTLTYAGVTIYGTVDVGYAYQSAGVPLSGSFPGGLEYQAFTTTRNFHGSQSTLAESGLEQSKIGIKIEENIGYGFTAIGKLETGFNPLSGELTDACASIARNGNVGTPANPAGQTANGDSSRCGQAFNSVAYGGVSSPIYGTLTIGRHNALQLDTLAGYDPQALSYAFSFLGYSGFNGGSGSTEAARWDNSVKYAVQFGPVHAAGMYSDGGADTGILGDAYGANVGFAYKGLSVDGVYQNIHGAVNLRSAFDDVSSPLTNPPTAPGLAAYISNDESWNIMGKYTFEFGGGFKDEGPTSKLTLYGGYSHIEKSHSDYTSGGAQDGYPISVGININKAAIYDMEWGGAKYQTGPWSFTGAYYHADQNSWTIGLGTKGNDNIGCTGAGLLCAGDFNEASFVVDYAFNKHFDIYTGVNFSQVTNGLANGFSGSLASGTTGSQDQTTWMSGLRIKF